MHSESIYLQNSYIFVPIFSIYNGIIVIMIKQIFQSADLSREKMSELCMKTLGGVAGSLTGYFVLHLLK